MLTRHFTSVKSHRATVYGADQSPMDIDLNSMVMPKEAGQLLWVSLLNPDNSTLQEALPHALQAQPRIIEEMLTRHKRPKVVDYGSCCLVVAITCKMEKSTLRFGEMQLLFGDGFLISVWRNAPFYDDELRADLQDNPELIKKGTDYLVAELLHAVTDSYAEQLLLLESLVERVEATFFAAKFKTEDIEKAYRLRRSLLRMQSAIAPLSELARRFSRQLTPHVSVTSYPLFAEVADRIARMSELTSVLRDTVAFAFEGGTMIIQLHQNDIFRKLAAWAAILAIPTAIAGIYGMNFSWMPELQWRFGYPLILVLMALICCALYYRFKGLGWL